MHRGRRLPLKKVVQSVRPCAEACRPEAEQKLCLLPNGLASKLKTIHEKRYYDMVSSNRSKTTKSTTRRSGQGTTSSETKTTVVTSSHREETQTMQSPDSKTVQQTTLKEETTTVVTSSHKSETAGSNLSTKRPTQLSEIYVRQSEFEDSFMEDVRIQCDDIEKKIDLVLQACRKLIDTRFVMMKNKPVWYDRDTAA